MEHELFSPGSGAVPSSNLSGMLKNGAHNRRAWCKSVFLLVCEDRERRLLKVLLLVHQASDRFIKCFYTTVPFTTSLRKHLCCCVRSSMEEERSRSRCVWAVGGAVMECGPTSYSPPRSSGFVRSKMYLLEVRDVEGLVSLSQRDRRTPTDQETDLLQLAPGWWMPAL